MSLGLIRRFAVDFYIVCYRDRDGSKVSHCGELEDEPSSRRVTEEGFVLPDTC